MNVNMLTKTELFILLEVMGLSLHYILLVLTNNHMMLAAVVQPAPNFGLTA